MKTNALSAASVSLLTLFVCAVGFAQTKQPFMPPAVKEIEKLQSLQNIVDTINDYRLAAESMVTVKFSDCLKAFGNNPFCSCIRDQTPVGIGFQGYVRIMTTPKEELNYDKLSDQDRRIIDNTHTARNLCVGSIK